MHDFAAIRGCSRWRAPQRAFFLSPRVQALLLAAAEALAAGGRREELQTVVAFAAAVPNRVSQAAYQRLNLLQAGVA